jgi:RimJ/RimL family protein N-acetyltransferase
MLPPEKFSTPRLRLRRLAQTDAEAIFHSYAQDTEVTRFAVWSPHISVDASRAYVQRCLDGWENGTEYTWAICLLDGSLIGALALRVTGFKADTGYVIARRFWGQGYAAEALQAIVAWAFAQATIYRVWAVCDVENTASARVMEKAGMTREGILRRWILHPQAGPEPRDCYCYSIVKSEPIKAG